MDYGDDYPRSMRDEGVRQRRQAMLELAHIARLTAYVRKLRERGLGEVPDFDPLDGGVEARVLFLLEKPGPMTSSSGSRKRVGSGFISRNNDDQTAAATIDFMRSAGIPRELTVTWNLIPWWNGTRSVTKDELREGASCVRELIDLLPCLRAVVMVGDKAARVKPFLATTGLALFASVHPSPLVRAKFRDRWDAIPLEWAKVLKVCEPT
jgi:uracil-DNA glycosylase